MIKDLNSVLDKCLEETPIYDIHTHLFSECFGDLLLWGIDELLVYHYVLAEANRYNPLPPEELWAMSKKEMAEYVWKTVFIDHTPVSESAQGVLTILHKLGCPVSKNLDDIREYFAKFSTAEFVDKIFEVSNVKKCIMTNDPFDSVEGKVWDTCYKEDPRFETALRLDSLLMKYEEFAPKLKEMGYDVSGRLNPKTIEQIKISMKEAYNPIKETADVLIDRLGKIGETIENFKDKTFELINEKSAEEIKRFLRDYVQKFSPVYMACSMLPDFKVPEMSYTSELIEKCVLPVCEEFNIPFAMMIGVKRQVNPNLKLAGDGAGHSDISTVEYLCSKYPKNKFMLTHLTAEDQHLAVICARKFPNLHVFGCWWFSINPVIMDHITRMRIEMIGTSATFHHSDARVLDQLIYKWSHFKRILKQVLYEKYTALMETGWTLTEEEIKRDTESVLGGEFEKFLARKF